MKPSKQRNVFMHKLNIKDANEFTTDKNLPKSQLKFKHFWTFSNLYNQWAHLIFSNYYVTAAKPRSS